MRRALLAIASLAVAAPSFAAPAEGQPPGSTPQVDRKALNQQFRALAEERARVLRERGAVFSRIAVDHDYRGEYVLYRDADCTAFLDVTDPRHPRYVTRSPGEDAMADPGARSHILVVPNVPHEHIGKTLGSDITPDDIELVAKLMRTAGTLAKRLGIKAPKIYVKSEDHIGLGYLHIHVVGERAPSAPYPPPLK